MMRSLPAVLLLSVLALAARASDQTLIDYVQQPDDTFAHEVRREIAIDQTRGVEVLLTSQTWHGVTWKHQTYVIMPRNLTAPGHAVLVIAGGSWKGDSDAPPSPDAALPGEARMFAGIAERLGSPVVVLMHVPFQPIFGNLKEDAAIAHTFDRFLETGDESWPLLLPMTKSAVRAMDMTQAVVKERWGVDVERFTVTGASKRGWTTWLTGAVDPRVAAIAPMVIDMLNLAPQMRHQIASWGAFSRMIHDYEKLDIMARLEEPAGRKLVEIVDPYAYRDRLTMPKLVVLGTNDPYWPVDALNQYWGGLLGEKRILYIPNAGHGLETGLMNVLGGLMVTHLAAAGQVTLPTLDWSVENGQDTVTIRVTSDKPPVLAQAWTARTPTRDFRGSSWVSLPIVANEAGEFVYTLPRPDKGHAAAYVNLVFRDGDLGYNLCTQMGVIGAPAPVEVAPD